MSASLLDVNVLIALLDSAHVHHSAVVRWFHSVATRKGWATAPITENGFIRIVSHPSYPNLRVTPEMAAQSLDRFKTAFPKAHRFWPDKVTLTDGALFDLTVLTGSQQITDVYLAGLAFRHKGRLATLERGIAWKAVRGAEAGLIENIPVPLEVTAGGQR